MTEENKQKVLYIVEDTKSPQFRYRVSNLAEALNKSKRWEVEWTTKDKIRECNLNQYEFVVILRQTAKDGTLSGFIKQVQKLNKKVLFDLDDLIFDYRDLAKLMNGTNSKNFCYWIGYIWGIRRIAKVVDGFITTSDFLAKQLERSFGKKSVVIPNSLNDRQVEISKEVLKQKKHDGFRIGYFSGSPTHMRDFGMVEEEIRKFLCKYEDAILEIVGYMKLSKKMDEMVKNKKIILKDLMNYEKLLREQATVDVNVAPLFINDFTNAKSELKFFEAGIVETVTIASPTDIYKKVITDGKNGLLAKPGEWFDKLEYLYNNVGKRKQMAENARKYALKEYYGAEFLKKVERAYEEF